MKWLEWLGGIMSFLLFTQLIKWILDSLGMKESVGEPLVFFLSAIFSLLTIIVLILTQQHRKIKEMEEFLKKKGLKVKKSFIEKMINNKKNKKGVVDPRILWIIIAIIILYLLWKSGFFARLFGV
jgi:hypothetical protein